MATPICRQCGDRAVEKERAWYATPVCYTCLPPPPPLPVSEINRRETSERGNLRKQKKTAEPPLPVSEITWRETSDRWRASALAWQEWATALLDDLARQPLYGEHGDKAAREIIATLAGMAPAVPRCSRCGCFASRHEADDEELLGCVDCECTGFES